MKNARLSICVAAMILITLRAPLLVGQETGQQERAPDMLQVCGKNCKVLFENENVRVTKVVLKKGAKLDRHFHACRSIWLTAPKPKASRLNVTSADGKSQPISVRPNEAQFSDPVTHTMENVGTSDYQSVVIEQKCPAFVAPGRR